jgi:hypothetical protein
MKTTKYNKSEIMSYAHECYKLRKRNGVSFGECFIVSSGVSSSSSLLHPVKEIADAMITKNKSVFFITTFLLIKPVVHLEK